MNVVPNEWLLEYLIGTENEQARAHLFLDTIEAQGHKLVIRQASSFSAKLFRFMKSSSKPMKRLYLLLWDADKVWLLSEHDIQPVPQQILESTPHDDTYLVETAHSVPDSVIVTTDNSLKNKLEGHLRIVLVDEFPAG